MARYRALGAVGVAVPVVGFCAAILGSGMALALPEPGLQFGGFAVVLLACGVACRAVLPAVAAKLGERLPGGPGDR